MTTLDKQEAHFHYESILKVDVNIQRWNELAVWKRKLTEPSPSHTIQITGMKCQESEVNQYANWHEPFHWKKTIFGVETCIMSNFKPQDWSIYKEVTEAEETQG